MIATSPPPGETPDPTPASLGPGAVEYLHAFVAAVEVLFQRSGSGLSPLDWRVAESMLDDRQREQILQGGAPPASPWMNAARIDRDRRWQLGVMVALDAGAKLDQTLPETIEATPARCVLYAVLDVLRFETELNQLPNEWPHIRSVLRCYVLGYVREDDPEDLEALDQALEACGVAPLCEPEPCAAAAALRTVLRELLATRATRRERFLLRSDFGHAHARGSSPHRGRYLLAVSLSERRPLVAGGGKPLGTARSSGLLEDPRPNDQPTLPAALVAPALILLAVLDALEAKADGGGRRPRESAYHVLRIVSAEKRWPVDQRAQMESVLNGGIPSDDALSALIRPVTTRPDAPPYRDDPGSQGGCVSVALQRGDGTETPESRIHPVSEEVSSPPPLGSATVWLFVFEESLRTGTGAPRERGWVEGCLVRDGGPGKNLRISRQQYEALATLSKDRVVVFPIGASGRKSRDRLRRKLMSWGVRLASEQYVGRTSGRRGERATLLRLGSHFSVHLADGIADRAASARRLLREAERDHYLGQY